MRQIGLATMLLAGTALSALAEDLPVRSVTLSSGGLAQIERSGEVAAGGSVTFRAPTTDIDDLLRSLVVADPAGTVEGVRLPARDLAEEAFRGLPLRPADFESRAALLNALRGQEATATGATGRIADAQETQQGLRVTLITPRGLVTALLREGEEVQLTDAGLAARVARAAEALAAARTADERRVEIGLRADRARNVAVLYVTGAPLWKPSWRLLVPAPGSTQTQARLQGWAVVENASGSDWERIRLALVSGEAAAFHQPLYEPIRVPRIEMPVRVPDAVRVQADTGTRPPPPPPPPAPAPMAAPTVQGGVAERQRALGGAPSGFAAAQQDRADPSAPALPIQAAATAGRVAFALGEPVTIRAGETANVPFLDARLPADRVWWIQDLSARNPLSAIRIRNSLPTALPDGLVTVFGAEGNEAGAFLGDAEIRTVAQGDTRILAFARDRDVQFTTASSSTDRIARIGARRGFVIVDIARTEEVAIAIDPRGGRGPIIVDVPRRQGATPRFPVVAEGDFGLRAEATLAAEPATMRLPFERAVRQEVPLWDAGLGDLVLLRWREFDIEQNQRRLPGGPGTLERLQEILGRTAQDVPGRADLAATVEALEGVRRLLDELRTRIRVWRVTEAALGRARQAVEDRTGQELAEARRRLNAASRESEQAAAVADQAWENWLRAVQALLTRGG
ncbi:hypothetical protein GXW71_29965 [Roseomonas hellenica]|uniref:DUF4139 domain-containing protein n=1 Tax=Plastoroseomonas hellenica TaxID=2687306 RepID=A0ABS5F7S4_9PROT|nr:hypothetical protein [Plastoroseomonas hellenica]MBR0668616.1 hypothetical protein [Plastoroseomonas hellenica]